MHSSDFILHNYFGSLIFFPLILSIRTKNVLAYFLNASISSILFLAMLNHWPSHLLFNLKSSYFLCFRAHFLNPCDIVQSLDASSSLFLSTRLNSVTFQNYSHIDILDSCACLFLFYLQNPNPVLWPQSALSVPKSRQGNLPRITT